MDLAKKYKESAFHKDAILESEMCVCFFCVAKLAPNKILDWIDDGQTAICPRCGIDSVLPYEDSLTMEFLQKMNDHYFG